LPERLLQNFDTLWRYRKDNETAQQFFALAGSLAIKILSQQIGMPNANLRQAEAMPESNRLTGGRKISSLTLALTFSTILCKINKREKTRQATDKGEKKLDDKS